MNDRRTTLDISPEHMGIWQLLRQLRPTWILGSEEPEHQLTQFGKLFQISEQHPAVTAPALDILAWGFMRNPCDPRFSGLLAKIEASPRFLSPGLKDLARALAQSATVDIDCRDFDMLASSGEAGLITKHCLPLIKNRATGLFWLMRAWKHFSALPGPDLAPAALNLAPFTKETQPLKARLAAEMEFLHFGPESALENMTALMDTAFGPWARLMASELALGQNATEQGIGYLNSFINSQPYLVNPILKLHDLLASPTPAKAPEKDEAAILLYSWNKADLMRDTLKNLAETNLGGAKVFALDNGSTDRMPDVLEQAEQYFEPGRYEHVRLPINVGAPSARNWLLSLPEVRRAGWAAFLDDDVHLPKNWLVNLLGAAKAQKADIAGLRITSAGTPSYIQSADYQMMHPNPGTEIVAGVEQSVFVFDNCAGSPDFGLFNYTRPCLSVSGCCHILSRKSLEAVGGFDIRYSPTQFDDLDRDIQAGLRGQKVVYHGQTRIKHIQFSSLAKAQTLAQAGGVMGNQIKLNAKYSAKDTASLAVKNMNILWDDLAAKLKALSG